jgi:transposase
LRSYEAGETVCAVARRYALSPQQLFAWRRASRKLPEPADLSPPLFVPAVLPAREELSAKPIRRQPSQKAGGTDKGTSIELEIDGVSIRIGRGAETKTVAAIIRALKATS